MHKLSPEYTGECINCPQNIAILRKSGKVLFQKGAIFKNLAKTKMNQNTPLRDM